MGLSPDPEKRAKQIANLQLGSPAAAARLAELDVVPYTEPTSKADAPKPKAKRTRTPDPGPEPPAGDDDGVSANGLIFGLAGLALLMLVLGRRPE